MMKNLSLYLRLIYICLIFSMHTNAKGHAVTVASKRFTESYVLTELIASRLEEGAQIAVVRKQGLGSTGIVFNALKAGEIDIYPEY